MSSVTGTLYNNTTFSVTVSSGGASHGDDPSIINATVAAGDTKPIFIANSCGAGVEGNVLVKNSTAPAILWTLHYDDPVIGSNSGSVSSPQGHSGSCDAGGGDNANYTYTIT